MCGVFGYVGKSLPDLSGFILKGLSALEYRGYDSSGMAIFNKGNVKIFKAVGQLDKLKKKIENRKYSGDIALGHTRWATHGKVTLANSHPHTDCKGNIIVVHNGIIENYEVFKNRLIKKGHKFRSQTDSEVFPHLVEEFLKNENISFKDAVRRSFCLCKGLNAIVTVSSRGEIIACRKGSPLVAGVGKYGNYISSDTTGLSSLTQNIVFIEDEQGVILTKNQIILFDLNDGNEKPAVSENILIKEKKADKGRFKHFLLKEIHEQSDVVGRVTANNKTEIEKISHEIKNAYGTYFTACGTAAYAGMAATYMFSEIAQRHVNFSLASEFPYFENFLVKDSLLIAASQSGETMDTLEAVRAAKRHKSKILAVVNVPGSSLERVADFTLRLNAGPERAVLATKSYVAKLATFLLLAYTMSGKYAEGVKILEKTAAGIKEMFSEGLVEETKSLARKLSKSDDIYLIGRGVNYPTALEGALKIKEASYIHAEGFPGGELKHGTIALIEDKTPCIVIVANDKAKEEILSNAMEVAARGAYIIGISPVREKVFDEWIKVPDAGTASPIVSVIPLQLMGYYLSLFLGRDPDKPRNLAKSVTVK